MRIITPPLPPRSPRHLPRPSASRVSAGLPGTAHVSAVFVGDEPKNRSSIVMRWLTGAPSCYVNPGKMAAAPCKEPDVSDPFGSISSPLAAFKPAVCRCA